VTPAVTEPTSVLLQRGTDCRAPGLDDSREKASVLVARHHVGGAATSTILAPGTCRKELLHALLRDHVAQLAPHEQVGTGMFRMVPRTAPRTPGAAPRAPVVEEFRIPVPVQRPARF